MFCPKCGANLPDGAPFCSSCGNQFQPSQAPQQPPVYQQPEQPFLDPNMPPVPVHMVNMSAKARGLSKKEFLATEASDKAKNMSKLSFIAFALAAIFVIVGVFTAQNTAFYDLPVVAAFVDEDERDAVKEDLESGEEVFERAEDALEDFEDDLDEDDYKVIENFIKKGQDMIENPSLASMTATLDAIEKIADLDLPEELEGDLDVDTFDEIDEISSIFGVITGISYGFGLFIILIALLASVFKKSGLAVFAIILNLPLLITTNFIWILLTVASLIALIVMCSTINKEYKGA